MMQDYMSTLHSLPGRNKVDDKGHQELFIIEKWTNGGGRLPPEHGGGFVGPDRRLAGRQRYTGRRRIAMFNEKYQKMHTRWKVPVRP